jgi:hypothetical protein
MSTTILPQKGRAQEECRMERIRKPILAPGGKFKEEIQLAMKAV